MNTKNTSNFILVCASIGVVVFHFQGSHFYIGNYLIISDIVGFYSDNGFFKTIVDLLRGVCAIVGIFFINSGYGLSKKADSSVWGFYKDRFFKIIFYAFLCGLLSSFFYYIVESKISISWLYCLTPFFGFFEIVRDNATKQYWFLSCIITYYIAFPFIKKYVKLFVIFVVIFSIFLFSVAITLFDVTMFTSMYHSTLFRFPEFLLGVIMARTPRFENFIFKKSTYSLFISIVFFILGYFLLFVDYLYIIALFSISFGAYLFLAQISYVFYSIFSDLKKYISQLSQGTFSLYLLHMSTIYYLYNYFVVYIDSLSLGIYVLFLTKFLMLLLLSGVLLLVGGYIDKIFNKYIIKKYGS